MRAVQEYGIRIAGVLIALVLTLLVFGVPVGKGMSLLYEGAFHDKFALSQMLVKTTPLLITGVAIAIAWRAGAYNIGGEGQLILGAVLSAALAKVFLGFGGAWIGPLAIPFLLVASMLGGAMWAGFSGWLYLKRGVEFVISTILLNFIAIQLLGYLVHGPLRRKDGGVPLTDILPEGMMLGKFDRQMDLHWGVFIALAVAVAAYVWLYLTKGGFVTRIVGENARLARANRIDSGSVKLRGVMISGALCGLAGGIQYLGISGQLGESFSQNYGFVAIPVALLGNLNPIAIIGSALFFGALFASSTNFSAFTHSGSTLIYVIQAVSIFGLLFFQWLSSLRAPAKEAQT